MPPPPPERATDWLQQALLLISNQWIYDENIMSVMPFFQTLQNDPMPEQNLVTLIFQGINHYNTLKVLKKKLSPSDGPQWP